MWWKGFVIVQLIVLRNIIFSQPIIESGNDRSSKAIKYEECCPCPGANDVPSLRDEDFIPSQISSIVRSPVDECPCRFMGTDSEGSSSIFYPSFLRGVQPMESARDSKQGLKPLLQPEVGLASSVLETLKEATDEEYKEALARDASKIALKAAEPNFLDAEHDSTRNSVTIVINPRDLDDGYDAITEASHVHETRCIHSPLGSSNSPSSQRVALPRLSNKYLLVPKRKVKVPLHNSWFDMDNSPSNIQESFDFKNENHPGSRLKMNPLSLYALSNKMPEKVEGIRDSWPNSATKLRKISPEKCDDVYPITESNITPIFTLATLKNKLRDLNEMRNAKRLKNNLQGSLFKNKFNMINNEPDDSVSELPLFKLPTPDSVFDKQSPLAKKGLQLKDVEIIPPRKTNIEDTNRNNKKYMDLKVAGTETKADILMMPKANDKQSSNECAVVNSISVSDEYFSDDSKEIEPKSKEPDISTTPAVQSLIQDEAEKTSLENGPMGVSESVCVITEIPDNDEQDFENECRIKTDFEDKSSEINDTKNDKEEKILDSAPESSNVKQNTFPEEEGTQNVYWDTETSERDKDTCYQERLSTVDPNYLPTNTAEEVKSLSSVRPNESSRHSSFKDDILRRLENLRNAIKSKLEDTPKNSQVISNTSVNYNITNANPISEKHVTIQDLQRLSNALLSQENLSSDKTAVVKENLVNVLSNSKTYENNDIIGNESLSEMDYPGTQLVNIAIQSPNSSISNYDDTMNNILNSPIENYAGNSENLYICDTISNENYDDVEGDVSIINEMSSQPSNLNSDTLKPELSDNQLRSLAPQNIVQPSFMSHENNFNRPFNIPSLEEIKKSITNIIDAGQREEKILGSTESDPLNESSNINSVRSSNTNLRSELPSLLEDHIYKLRSFQNTQSNLLVPRLNINSYRASPEIAPLKKYMSESMLSNRAGKIGNSLTSSTDKIKSSWKSKPDLDNIKRLLPLNTPNIFKQTPIQLPRTSAAESPLFTERSLSLLKNDLKSYADDSLKMIQSNFRETAHGNQGLLSKGIADSNDIFESVARKREDMKEKLQALHVDFSDRLATIHNKLLDQTNLQSVKTPVYKDNSEKFKLPAYRYGKGRNVQNLFPQRLANKEPESLFKSKHLPKEDHKANIQKNVLFKDSQDIYQYKGNDNDRTMKQNMETLKDNISNAKKKSDLYKEKKIDEFKNNLDKQRGLTSLRNSNIKISFSTTTMTPVTGLKKLAQNHALKFPLDTMKENSDAINPRFKDIFDAYRLRLKNDRDSNHAPSELIPLRSHSMKESPNGNKAMKSSQSEADKNSSLLINTVPKFKSKMGQKQADPKSSLAEPVATLTKETPFVTNLREALRSRLTHIASVTKNPPINKHDVKPTIDAVESPSENFKTIETLTNPLKENTSYKCTMMCVKD